MNEQAKVEAIIEELMELKQQIIDQKMIEMLLTFIVSKNLDEELKTFSLLWIADNIVFTHKGRET